MGVSQSNESAHDLFVRLMDGDLVRVGKCVAVAEGMVPSETIVRWNDPDGVTLQGSAVWDVEAHGFVRAQ